MGIRMEPEEEMLGADWVEHRVRTENFAMKLENALMDMRIKHEEFGLIVTKVGKRACVLSKVRVCANAA